LATGENLETVLRFFRAVNRNDEAAIRSYFGQDSVFHNIPMDPVVGPDAIWGIMKLVHDPCSAVDWRLHSIAEAPDGTVLTERTDRYRIDGKWIEYPLMGIFEIRRGTILAWRDYFDLRQSIEQTFAHTRPSTNLLKQGQDAGD
jgi:limonene-1,2-epoxide hydrolase